MDLRTWRKISLGTLKAALMRKEESMLMDNSSCTPRRGVQFCQQPLRLSQSNVLHMYKHPSSSSKDHWHPRRQLCWPHHVHLTWEIPIASQRMSLELLEKESQIKKEVIAWKVEIVQPSLNDLNFKKLSTKSVLFPHSSVSNLWYT